jgi:predicted O-methyltransferase YrrM
MDIARKIKGIAELSVGGRYREVTDRLWNKVDMMRDHSSPRSGLSDIIKEEKLFENLTKLFGEGSTDYLESDGLESLERHIEEKSVSLLQPGVPYGLSINGTRTLGRLCYIACRSMRPNVVLETGVAYGVSSAYVLQALAENGGGHLHSVDLPPLGAETFSGYLVPAELRNRWSLNFGSSKKILPKIVSQIKPLDIFIHDSLHTYAHMKWEFEVARPAVRHGGLIISDDIEGNRAFEELIATHGTGDWVGMRQDPKPGLCGAVGIH